MPTETFDDFTLEPFTAEGITKNEYWQGAGPAVFIMTEMTGITTDVAGFARRVAEAVLFMTWAYSDKPEMITSLASAFTRLGLEELLMVIPVGLAFEQARQEIPGIVLHDPDRLHPSLKGTYLAAAVFYAALYGKSPESLAYDAGLDSTLAQRLRRIAWQTVSKYKAAPKGD